MILLDNIRATGLADIPVITSVYLEHDQSVVAGGSKGTGGIRPFIILHPVTAIRLEKPHLDVWGALLLWIERCTDQRVAAANARIDALGEDDRG